MKKTLWLFCLKRLASLPIILLGVSLLTFFLMRIVPIEPAEVILRLSGVKCLGCNAKIIRKSSLLRLKHISMKIII